MEKRRSAPRIKVQKISAGIKLKRSFFNRGKEEKVTILDIGPKGMSFVRDRDVSPGTQVSFVIDFKNRQTIRGVGMVRNCRERNPGYIMGMEFIKLSRQGRAFLGRSRNIFEYIGDNLLDLEMPIADKIKLLRTRMGLTAVEVALASGVPTELVFRIESGIEENPSEDALAMLARGMGVTAADLAGKKEYLSLLYRPLVSTPVPLPSTT